MIFHIIPVLDIEEHEISAECECNPQLEIGTKGMILIHNAFDGREAIQEAEALLGMKNEPENDWALLKQEE